MSRVRLVLCALALVGLALTGVQTSSASYVRTSTTPVSVTSAADWTPPTVSVTDPGTPVKDTVTVNVAASDPESGVASVVLEYLAANGDAWVTICTDATAPYSCAWNTRTVSDGNYELRARATDNAGFAATSARVSTVVANSPVVILSNPGDVVRGTVPLQVTVYSGSLLTFSVRVEYAVAGSGTWRTLCNGVVAPYTCAWNTASTPFASGTEYDLRASVVSGLATYTSATVDAVLVDNVAPTVTMVDPGSPLAGTRTFTATAADAHSGVSRVVLEYATTGTTTWRTLCTIAETPWSCSVATATLADGSYSFRAVATDDPGNTATSAAVTNRVVDNTVSSVFLADPGAFVSGTVTLNATASSTAGVTSVRVQRAPTGSTTWTDVCADTTSPYSCAWDTTAVADGSYDLRAVLLDGSGKTTTSAVVASRRVDNSPLRGVDVQSTNGGANAGRLESNDIVTLTYSRELNLGSVSTGWTGTPLAVSVRVRDGNLLGAGNRGDTLDVLRSGSAVNLGSVNLRQDYVKSSRTITFNATMTASTVVVGGVTQTVVTVRLGTVASGSGLRTASAAAAMTWTPSGSVTDTRGAACSTAPVTETGTLDLDF